MGDGAIKWQPPQSFHLFVGGGKKEIMLIQKRKKTKICNLQPGDSRAKKLAHHCQIDDETPRLRIIHYD